MKLQDIGVIAGGAVLAAGAAYAGMTLLGVGFAHADNGPFSGPAGDHNAESMWVDVEPFDHSVTVAEAGKYAQTMCESLRSGMSEGQIIAIGAQKGFTVGDATFLLHAAEWHFCPEYY